MDYHVYNQKYHGLDFSKYFNELAIQPFIEVWNIREEKFHDFSYKDKINAKDIIFIAHEKNLFHALIKLDQEYHLIAIIDSLVGNISVCFSASKIEQFLTLRSTTHNSMIEEMKTFKIDQFLSFIEKNAFEQQIAPFLNKTIPPTKI
jgi:hypothetical protein